jgi:TATA-binding protein-associated factor
MPKTSIFATERILVEMVRQDWALGGGGDGGRDRDRDPGRKAEGGLGYAWEVRHSGLLGLKYLVAVTEEFFRGDGDGGAGGEVKAEVVKEEEGLEGGRMDVDGVEHLGGRMLRAVVDAALIG